MGHDSHKHVMLNSNNSVLIISESKVHAHLGKIDARMIASAVLVNSWCK
jgi:hypothetical protein